MITYCCQSLIVPNLGIKLYHRDISIGKSTVYIEYIGSTLCGFRHLLGVLEHTPLRTRGTTILEFLVHHQDAGDPRV